MQARMKNPALIIPGALEALQALAKAAEKGGVRNALRWLSAKQGQGLSDRA